MGDLPTPMSSNGSRAGELLSSSPCPVPDKVANKPKGRPTITPRSFGRFFAPKKASRHNGSRGKTRYALSDSSASRLNSRSQKKLASKLGGSAKVFDEDENPDWGSNNISKRHRGLASPDTTPESASSVNSLKRTRIDISALSEASNEDDDRPTFRLRMRPTCSRVQRSTFRGALGNMARRELGNSTDGYCRVVGDFRQDWRPQVSDFYSGAQDVYVNQSSDGEYVTLFSTAACHSNSLVAIGDEDGWIRLMETKLSNSKNSKDKGFETPFHSFRPHNNAIIDLDFTQDDSRLATGSGDQTGRVIDMRTQQCIYELRAHRSSVKQVRFQPGTSSGNNVLATSGREGSVLLWDLRCRDTRGALNMASVRLDGDYDEPDLLQSSKPKRAAYTKSIRQAHSALPTSLSAKLTSSPILGDGAQKPRTRQLQARQTISITTLCFLQGSSSHLLLTGSEADACVRLWDLRSRQHNGSRTSLPVAVTSRPASHISHRDFGLTSMVLNGDGSLLYTLCKDHTVYTYSTSHLILGSAPEYSPTFNPGLGDKPTVGLGPLYGFRHPKLKASSFYVKAALRPASNQYKELLAVGGADGCAVVFPTDEKFLRQQQQRLTNAPRTLDALACTTPVGSRTRSSSSKNAHSWRDADALPIYTAGTALVRGHESEVTGLAWTSEGELVTAGDDFRCRVWREDPEKARSLRVCRDGENERWLHGWAETSDADSDDE